MELPILLAGALSEVVRSHLCAFGCRITAVAAGLNHTVALTVAGDIFMCGHNKHGALGLGDTVSRFLPTKVETSSHTESSSLCRVPLLVVPGIEPQVTQSQAACVEPPCFIMPGRR